MVFPVYTHPQENSSGNKPFIGDMTSSKQHLRSQKWQKSSCDYRKASIAQFPEDIWQSQILNYPIQYHRQNVPNNIHGRISNPWSNPCIQYKCMISAGVRHKCQVSPVPVRSLGRRQQRIFHRTEETLELWNFNRGVIIHLSTTLYRDMWRGIKNYSVSLVSRPKIGSSIRQTSDFLKLH